MGMAGEWLDPTTVSCGIRPWMHLSDRGTTKKPGCYKELRGAYTTGEPRVIGVICLHLPGQLYRPQIYRQGRNRREQSSEHDN